MKHKLSLIVVFVLSTLAYAADAGDPFAKVLDGKAPAITKEFIAPPSGITVRRVLFRIRDKNEAYAVIATPNTPGKHPGILASWCCTAPAITPKKKKPWPGPSVVMSPSLRTCPASTAR